MNGHIFGETGDIRLLDLRIVEIIEVIEDHDGVSCREQVFNEMGADKTGSSCDQNSHLPRSSTTTHTQSTENLQCSIRVTDDWRPEFSDSCTPARQHSTAKKCASASADRSSVVRSPRGPLSALM